MSWELTSYDGGEVVELHETEGDWDGDWARSEHPHPLVTLDFNAAGELIRVVFAGMERWSRTRRP